MNKVRWGIIGPGSIANNFADALKQSYSGELTAIASLNEKIGVKILEISITFEMI